MTGSPWTGRDRTVDQKIASGLTAIRCRFPRRAATRSAGIPTDRVGRLIRNRLEIEVVE